MVPIVSENDNTDLLRMETYLAELGRSADRLGLDLVATLIRMALLDLEKHKKMDDRLQT
ncbi:hypothetical protein [Tardiphaga sp.]|uniref:hypothetical protein n=1 Tax=Tardiphaga sp. TaxID=1926292 RepID=UPI002620FB48|nr:hypothetical protein [Tardiphaga sp.]